MSKETFLADHKHASDETLLGPPAAGPLTALTLFVCTYVAKLANLHIGFADLTHIMCVRPHGCLLAINSNYGHAAQKGYEQYIKVRKPAPERRVPARGRPRAVQGDGTCFNSAVEPIIAIDHPLVADDKIYKVKCFSTTGETQVPGVILPDLSDGHIVLEAFVQYLNELGVGDPEFPATEENPTPPRKLVTIEREQPKMINYKFRLVRNSPRILVNLHALASYLFILEKTKVAEGAPLTEAQAAKFVGWPVVVLPPFAVREMKSPTDDVKVSFRFKEVSRTPRINIFQEGKINILGADSAQSAEKFYDFFVRLFTANWTHLVTLQPRRDLERRQALRAPPPRPPAPAPPAVNLTDDEVNLVLDGVLDYGAPPPEVERLVGLADKIHAVRAALPSIADEFGELREKAKQLRGKHERLHREQAEAERELNEGIGELNYEQLYAVSVHNAGPPAIDTAVDDIVAALDEWTFDDEAAPDGEAAPENQDDDDPSLALQDPVLGQVDREDVE